MVKCIRPDLAPTKRLLKKAVSYLEKGEFCVKIKFNVKEGS